MAQSEEYTTVEMVRRFLRIPSITAETTPSKETVQEEIYRAQDEIDNQTKHSWRTRYNGTYSGDATEAVYEYIDVDFNYEYQTGRPFALGHRRVKTFDTNSGDKMEIWNGESWVDWINEHSEGRGSEFWVNYEDGWVYLKAFWAVRKPVAARMKYRYGDTVVPKDIEKACLRMVAIELLTTDSKSPILPEGSAQLNFRDKIEIWERQIETILQRYKEFQVLKQYT